MKKVIIVMILLASLLQGAGGTGDLQITTTGAELGDSITIGVTFWY